MESNIPRCSKSRIELGSHNRKTHLHKNEFHSQLDFNCLNIIYNDRLLCDVTLVAEGRELQAHKLILASCSLYFYWRFSQDRHTRQLNRIEIQNMSYESLSAVIGYLYKSEVLITEDNVKDLLTSANLFALRDLQQACSDFLKANVTPTNCVVIGNIAKNCQCEELVATVSEYVMTNFPEIVKQQAYLDMSFDQLSQLARCDALCIAEEDVLDCVIEWVKYDMEHRKEHIYPLMKNVRFTLIPPNNILQRLQSEKWLTADPQYNLFLVEVLTSYIMAVPIVPSSHRQSSKCLIVAGYTHVDITSKLSVEFYDLEKNIWFSCRRTLELDPDETCRVAILNNKIYCTESKSLKSIDFNNPNQTKLSYDAQLLEERLYCNVDVLNDSIYAVGGQCRSTERFDVSLKVSSKLASMSEEKSYVGLGVLNGNMYAVGGKKLIADSYFHTNSIECYKPESDMWYKMPDMSIARSLPGVAALGENLYVVGGRNEKGACNQVEMFNPADLSWKRLPDMNSARIAPGVISNNGLLYVMGGWDETEILNCMEVYNPKTSTWSLLPSRMNIGKFLVATALVDKASIKL